MINMIMNFNPKITNKDLIDNMPRSKENAFLIEQLNDQLTDTPIKTILINRQNQLKSALDETKFECEIVRSNGKIDAARVLSMYADELKVRLDYVQEILNKGKTIINEKPNDQPQVQSVVKTPVFFDLIDNSQCKNKQTHDLNQLAEQICDVIAICDHNTQSDNVSPEERAFNRGVAHGLTLALKHLNDLKNNEQPKTDPTKLSNAPYKAIDVAYYILNYYNDRNDPINNLKLQKLLYFTQVYFVKIKNKKLFNEEIQMWRHGGNVPDVYQSFRKYVSQPIWLSDQAFINTRPLTDDDKTLINTILIRTHDLSDWRLVSLIQKSEIYKETYVKEAPQYVLSFDDLKNAEINF